MVEKGSLKGGIVQSLPPPIMPFELVRLRVVVEHEGELHVQRGLLGIQAASERSERLASLLTLSYEPMLAWRLDGPIEFWNAGAERLYGFAPDEAIGHSSHALLQTKFPIEFAEMRARLRMNGIGRRTAPYLQGRPRGHRRQPNATAR